MFKKNSIIHQFFYRLLPPIPIATGHWFRQLYCCLCCCSFRLSNYTAAAPCQPVRIRLDHPPGAGRLAQQKERVRNRRRTARRRQSRWPQFCAVHQNSPAFRGRPDHIQFLADPICSGQQNLFRTRPPAGAIVLAASGAMPRWRPPPKKWKWERLENGGFRFQNPSTGELLEGYLNP